MKHSKIFLAALLFSTSYGSLADEKNIDIWAWNINVPVLKKAAQEYEKQYPDVTVNILDIGRQDVYTKINVALQAKGKGLPDAFLVEDEYLAGFLANWPNAFADLSALGYDQYAGDFPQFKKAVTQIDGKFYAMPFDIGPVAVFYRPSYFKQSDVDPLSIETWDDYISAGKKINQATGAYMTITATDDDGFFRILMQQREVGYFDDKGNIDFNNPSVLESLTLIDDMEQQGILYTAGKGWDGFVQSITGSKIVAMPMGAWVAGTIESQAPDQSGDWRVMPLPKDHKGRRAANIGGSNFAIPAVGDNVDLAYDFMEFFTTNIANQVEAFKGGLYPSYLPIYKEPSFKEGVAFFGDQPIWADIAKTVPDIPGATYTIDYAIAREEGNKTVAEAITSDKNPSTILSNTAKRIKNQTGRKINKY